ncbi:MAG: hypothetical protein JNK61_03325 [Bacteroidia bacterium]|nr:hypothetical protein [Bacteroidia bacterium]HQV00783.1 hypothetical protein [Bacteroidia bacterium]
MSILKKENQNLFVPRDISWLSFNHRVLQEAADKQVPLIERIKFLGIFSSNLDEFFRVRVATIRRLIKTRSKGKDFFNYSAEEILSQIQLIVKSQQEKFEEIYKGILQELEDNNIFIIN